MAAGKKPVEQAVEMVIKTDKHEYWLGHDAHALIAHVRLAGKEVLSKYTLKLRE